MSWVRAAVLGAALALTVPAGAATPDDLAPAPEERFSSGRAEPVDASPWWQTVGDERLARAVDAAMAGNIDLRRARAIAEQLEGVSLQTVAGLSPQVSGNAGVRVAPMETLGFGFGLPQDPTAPKTYSQGQATLDAQWGVDVFGRSAATWRAAQRDASASDADLEGAGQNIAGLVANAYFDVVTAEERVSLVEAQIQTNAELLEVLELRYERGDAGSLDVLQQRQQVATSRAQLPTARLILATTRQRLAVLLGRSPTTPPETADVLPEPRPDVAVGTPRDLVDNRPDLRASAQRLESTRDRRWAAYAGFLPSLGVSAQTGWQFIDRGESTDQTFWNAGANVSVPIFGGGQRHGALKVARAAHDAQTAAHEGAVLVAIQQVEAALAQEREQRAALEAYEGQREAASQAFDTARAQYLEGVTPFLNVQSALARLQGAEQQLLQARRDLWTARINLHGALGGPWTRDLASNTETAR